MLDRRDVRVVETWEGYMNGKSGYQRIWHSRDHPERPQYTPAFFSKTLSTWLDDSWADAEGGGTAP